MTKSNMDLVPSVKSAVDAIIASEKFSSTPTITVTPGSQIGDGFASKTNAICIKDNSKVINLFAKYFPENPENPLVGVFSMAFNAEFRFYEVILPEMLKFQEEKSLKADEIFDNVPKHYKTGIKYQGIPPIILENLRNSGYTLRDYKQPIDDAHITLALKAFAKYHAVSFAMKHQKPDLFKQLSCDIKDFYVAAFDVTGMSNALGGMVDGFVSSLDTVSDKKLLNECRNLRQTLITHASTVHKHVDDYAVICQGDCWSNNMMFKYDEQTETPINIKLIDWQIQRYNSPVLDVSYFFYTVATKEILDNFDKYFKLYYDTLADYIKKLGSDPRKMYPRVVYLNHWKKFSKFGLTMSFGALRAQQMKKEEMPDLIDKADAVMPTLQNSFEGDDIYYGKIKLLVEHFIERDFL